MANVSPSAPIRYLSLGSDGPLSTAWLSEPNRFRRAAAESAGRSTNPDSGTDNLGPGSAAVLDRGPARRTRVDTRATACACPECGAPMSVRMWLLIADCWRCGICIELSAMDVATETHVPPRMRQRSRTRKRAADAPPTPSVPKPQRSRPARQKVAAPPIAQRRQVVPPVFCREAKAVVDADRSRRNWTSALTQLPAWLVSLLFHLLLLLILGILTLQPEVERLQITLSTAVGPQTTFGGRLYLDTTNDEPAFDLPVPDPQGVEQPEIQAALVLADEDARQLRADANHRDLPDLSQLHRALQQDGPERTFATRDPRLRVELVRQEGGTTMTEAAVARGLRWLSKHQADDGSWSLGRFCDQPLCERRCDGRGQVRSDAAATALAVLPFLGAGQTHQTGIYQPTVAAGLRWLVEHQDLDGDLRFDSDSQSGMYAHGQAAIVLSEAFAMTNDMTLRRPAQRAIQFIERSQHRRGGWRYKPGQRGDTSVLGWQMMALQSARAAGLRVSPQTLDNASYFLDTVADHNGVRYGYQRGHEATPTMTAEALLCRIYLGGDPRHVSLQQGMQWLVDRYPPQPRDPNIYYWYYATQALHHAGGGLWDDWNQQLRQVLVDSQIDQGHAAGSWDPEGPHATAGGRIYMTALAICTLEVYYRHAPIFRPALLVRR